MNEKLALHKGKRIERAILGKIHGERSQRACNVCAKTFAGVFGCVYMGLYTGKGTMNINDAFFFVFRLNNWKICLVVLVCVPLL